MNSAFARWIEPRKQNVNHSKLRFSNQDIKKLLIPLVIEQVLTMLVGMVDTAMISYAGELAVSGVSLVDMINAVFIYLFTAVATGGAIVVSQYLGYGQEEESRKAANQVVSFSCFFGAVLMIAVMIGNRGLLSLLFGSVEEGVMTAAVTYLFVTALSYPFLAVYNACAALFRSMGNSKVTMKASLLMNGINVVGNALAIFVLDAGVAGVAAASVLSRIVAAAVLFALLTKKDRAISLNFKDLVSFNPSLLKKVLGIAIPNGVESGFFQICRVTMTSIIATFGTIQIAANGVTNSIEYLNTIMNSAAGLAITTIVGQCVGANDYDQADYYLRKLLRITATCSFFLCLGVAAALPLIIKLYQLSPETIHYVYILVLFHGFLTVILGWPSGPFPTALRAAGDVRYSMYVAIIGLAFGRVFFSWLFAVKMNMQIYGMWLAMATHWGINAFGAYLRYRSGKWKEHRVITAR